MQFTRGIFTSIGVVSMVAACAQTTPPPAPIMAEPVFNKLGEPTGQCTNGYIYSTQRQTCEPPSECTPDNGVTVSNVGGIPCPPPPTGRQDGGGDNTPGTPPPTGGNILG